MPPMLFTRSYLRVKDRSLRSRKKTVSAKDQLCHEQVDEYNVCADEISVKHICRCF